MSMARERPTEQKKHIDTNFPAIVPFFSGDLFVRLSSSPHETGPKKHEQLLEPCGVVFYYRVLWTCAPSLVNSAAELSSGSTPENDRSRRLLPASDV